MSIIYDALKKVENTGAVSSSGENKEKDTTPRPKSKSYLIYLLVVCFGLFIGNLFFGFLGPTDKTLKKQIEPVLGLFSKKKTLKSGPALIVIAPTESRQEKKAGRSEGFTGLISNIRRETQPSLVLNGIFFSDNEGFALIDNQIVKIGDSVGKATVKNITVDEVELDNAGSLIKLSTRSSN